MSRVTIYNDKGGELEVLPQFVDQYLANGWTTEAATPEVTEDEEDENGQEYRQER